MNRPTDFQQREQALDITKSWIVQAPAGSGKTGILVYRLLKLLAIAQRPEEVLAITFTKKAAKEMRDRLLELLHAANQGQKSEDVFEQQGLDLAKAVLINDHQQDWQLLDMPHRLNIETIDALCARLVASMPWLSRLGDRPNTTENAHVHFQYAVEQLLLEVLEQEGEIYEELKELLLSLDNNFGKIRQLLMPMLARRDQWLRHFIGKDFQNSRADFEDTWKTISENILLKLAESVPVGTKEAIVELAYFGAQQRINAEMEKSPRERNAKNLDFYSAVFIDEKRFPRADFADIHLWLGVRDFLITTSGTLRSPRGVTKTIGFLPNTPEKERFIELLNKVEGYPDFVEQLVNLQHIPPASYTDKQWQKILILEKVLRRLLSYLQLRFHNSKECDFSEVALRANQALKDLGQPTDLALRMDYQIQHILVDEFQDTSHSQFTLLENLTKGWQQDDGRSLFLVGDPMQSIYRFREADVGLFVKLAEGRGSVNDIDLNSLVLTENFRSQKTLVDWFNQVFMPSFPKDNNETNGAIKYSSASSHKMQGETAQFAAFYDPETEAEHVVSIVKKALIRGDKKIAILVRSRPQLAPILPALRAANIQFEGVDIHPLEHTQDVLDVISLCKAIIRLDDKIAWLSLLRGPYVGMTLSDITLLCEGKDAVVWQRINSAVNVAKLSSIGKKQVERLRLIMKSALHQKQHVSLASLVYWTWQQLGGKNGLKNINESDLSVVWTLIRDLETGGDIEKISDLDDALQGLFAQTHIVAESSSQQVIVSTMHKSKGLQYDTVILPSLTRKGANQEKNILRWAEIIDSYGQERLLLAALDDQAMSNEKNTHYHYLQTLEKQREANEQLRLMYVACTRAKTNLFLSGVFSLDSKTAELKARNLKNSLIGGLWQQVKEQFHLAELEYDENGNGINMPDQTLYRLPEDFIVDHDKNVNWQYSNDSSDLQLSQDSQILQSAQDSQSLHKTNEAIEITYDWASQTAQATGIVLHDWLEHHSYEVLSLSIDAAQQKRWRAELQSLQLESKQIESALKRLSLAVHNIQQDVKAQWIFSDSQHTDIQNEFALTTVDDGQINHHRIDRTFVDADGVRWIIDYKSTTHFEDDVVEFIDQQIEDRAYKKQLERYARAFQQIESRKIKLGIYFPLLKQWREWAY